jgi:hypothetical protein
MDLSIGNPHVILPSVSSPAYAGSVHGLVVKIRGAGFIWSMVFNGMVVSKTFELVLASFI